MEGKVLVLSSHTPSLFWFRMDLMKAMLTKGYEVYAAAQSPESEWASRFQEHGIVYREIRVARNGLNPIKDFIAYKDIKRLLREIRPDKIFTFQAKTISYGCQAAHEFGITAVYPMVAGLGSVYIGTGLKNTFARVIMSLLYKNAFRKSNKVFFQNKDDKQELLRRGLLKEEQIVMVHGSGVNLEMFVPAEIPNKPAFLYIGRLIRDKGVMEYLLAAEQIKKEYGDDVRCMLVGPYDTNPSALSSEDLKPFIEKGIIEYFGEQTDVRPFIAQCSVYVLPSYHEGTPKTVLEAMAMQRAILTSDAPGCRETVTDGDNGYLIPVKDVKTLIEKMKYLIEHQETIIRMGYRSRQIAVEKFDVNKVNQVILDTMGMLF